MRNTQRNTNGRNEMKTGSTPFDAGYDDGYNGRTFSDAWDCESYDAGYDAGNCDRPSLEELSMDVAKEARDPLSF